MLRSLSSFFVVCFIFVFVAHCGAEEKDPAASGTERWSGLASLESAILGLKTLSPEIKNYSHGGKTFPDLWRAMKQANDGLIALATMQKTAAPAADDAVYNKTLLDLAEALRHVVADQKQTASAKFKVCNSVLKDLELKEKVASEANAATQARTPDTGPPPAPPPTPNSPSSLPVPLPPKAVPWMGTVEVSVATFAGGKTVSGCEVWSVLEAWDEVEDRFERFPTLSSPSIRSFAPGYYKMWTVREGHKGPVDPVIVTGDPRSRLVVELSAPE